jgi:hypothetical protein
MQSVQQGLQLKNQQEIAMLDIFLSKSGSCAHRGSNYNPRAKFGACRNAPHKFLYDLWRAARAKGLASLASWSDLSRMLATARRVSTCPTFNRDGRNRRCRVCARPISETGASPFDHSARGKLSTFGPAG